MATVSRVINNSGSVKLERRIRVQNTIKEMGYLPNQAARALVKQKTETIGIIVNNLCDPFFYDLIRGFETGAQQTSYNVVFCSVMGGDTKAKERYVQYLSNGIVDAVIIYGSYLSDEKLARYVGEKGTVKLLMIENDIPSIDCNKLLIDNVDGARIATEFLIENGHRAIAHIGGDPNIKVTTDRFNGFIETMKSAGLEVPEVYLQSIKTKYTNGYTCMENLIRSERRPSAVFCSDDAVACYAIKAAIDKGLRVPEDISVMGFDNQKILPDRYRGPEITTMEQPLFDIGFDSIQILVDQMSGQTEHYKKKTYKTTLVQKESTSKFSY